LSRRDREKKTVTGEKNKMIGREKKLLGGGRRRKGMTRSTPAEQGLKGVVEEKTGMVHLCGGGLRGVPSKYRRWRWEKEMDRGKKLFKTKIAQKHATKENGGA